MTISSSQSSVAEGTSVTFKVSANIAPYKDLMVSVAVTEVGSFISGTAPTSVTVESGDKSAGFTVATVNDSSDEANGSVTATLSTPATGAGYQLGGATSKKVDVSDDDVPTLTISSSDSSVEEGDDIDFEIASDIAPYENLTVTVRVTQSGNFIDGNAPTSVSLRKGKTSATLTVETYDDSSDEANGSVTATLRNPEAGAGYKLGSPKRKTVRVRDNDSPPLRPRPRTGRRQSAVPVRSQSTIRRTEPAT